MFRFRSRLIAIIAVVPHASHSRLDGVVDTAQSCQSQLAEMEAERTRLFLGLPRRRFGSNEEEGRCCIWIAEECQREETWPYTELSFSHIARFLFIEYSFLCGDENDSSNAATACK